MSRGALLGMGGVAAVLVAVVAAILLLGSSTAKSHHLTGSAYPNVDTSNSRDVGGPIDASNVASLHEAWTLPVTGKGEYGTYTATPVLSKGVVYSQDLASNVQAVSLQTGKVLWSRSYEAPSHGPNGVIVAEGRVYGTTPTAAFALEQSTGRQLWLVHLTDGSTPAIDMAPGFHDGIVYVSTVPGDQHEPSAGENAGTLYALKASSGEKLWSFQTVPQNTWSNGKVNWGGGVWYTPAFDEHGYMYFGVANPEPAPGTPQQPWASSRPGPDLYTDSLVKMNARTGQVQWYYQLTPHDVYDWDLQDPPILLNSGGTPMVIAAGKAGTVIALNRETGKLLWRRDVGLHNGHDFDSLYAMKREYSKLKLPELVYPGRLGGVIAPMATNGKAVFAPVVNLPQEISANFSVTEPSKNSSGELVALDVASGRVLWSHKFPSPAFSGATVVNDVVLTEDFEGTIYGFDAETGKLLWQSSLPAGSNAGVAVEGSTVLAPAGIQTATGQETAITAYRLPG